MLISLLPAVVALAGAQAPKTSTELLPLQHLCTSERIHRSPAWGSLLQLRENNESRFVPNNGDLGVITPDGIVDTLYGFMPDAIDEERLFLQPIDNNLLVVGESQLVDRVRSYLAEAAGILARPVQLEFTAWSVNDDEEPPTPILDAQMFASFASKRTALWRAVSTTHAGQTVGLEHMTWTRYVRGIEVEVAQKKVMTRPVTDRYGHGGAAAVRTFALIGSDDFAVHLHFAAARACTEVDTLQTGTQGAPDIQMPHLESYFGTCSARLSNGGAMAVSMRGTAATGGSLTLTLRVTGNPSAPPLSNPNAALLPVGALVSDSLSAEAQLPSLSVQNEVIAREPSSLFGRIATDELRELIAGVLATNDEAASEAKIGGGYLFVRGDPASVRRAEQLLRSLQDRFVQSVAVQHTATLEPVRATADNQTQHVLLHHLSMPTLYGREVAIYRMHETNVAVDILVEVATEAGGLIPNMQCLQCGSWFRARALPLNGTLHASIDLLCTVAPQPPQLRVMPGGGVLMPVELASARAHHNGFAMQGVRIDHGDGPLSEHHGALYRSKLTTSLQH